MSTKTAVALFTADLRVSDNPVLRAASTRAERLVPLFVIDSGIAGSGFMAPNRAAFLAGCLSDLDRALRQRGGRLVIRRGDVVEETCRIAEETNAAQVHVAAGVSRYATRREERLRTALAGTRRELRVHDGVITVVPPGDLLPSGASGRDHFAVFTPYFRRWCARPPREPLAAPRSITVPRLASEPVPAGKTLTEGVVSPALPAGGEGEARNRMRRWLSGPLDAYGERHDDLAGDATSRLSPYLHFGCLSPAELTRAALERGGPGADAFVRQLAWRDFHYQVLAARPSAACTDYRAHGDRWREDAADIDAWREGRTGYPIVDAAMRQLRHEGWMHNRARLITASFLTKTLYVDWRVGADHFLRLLVDGDIANNQMNWQWVAGTGTDTRPNRVLNPLAQATRYDPAGQYVRRWLPELAHIPGPAVHRPWRLPREDRRQLDYPEPVVDLNEGLRRFRHARGKA
jgi:deoxyribodipyrimidine photo-lyase